MNTENMPNSEIAGNFNADPVQRFVVVFNKVFHRRYYAFDCSAASVTNNRTENGGYKYSL